MQERKTYFYIDGFNLYYGLKSSEWKKYYWIDFSKLCQALTPKPLNILGGIKYFTARISNDPQKIARQRSYLEAISTLENVEIIEGVYQSFELGDLRCCGQPFHCGCKKVYIKHEEKRTDVNIAVHMLSDAVNDLYDTACLISADSDLVPVVQKVKELFPYKQIIIYFPPKRTCKELRQHADQTRIIFEQVLAKSQFPDSIINNNGQIIKRPKRWH